MRPGLERARTGRGPGALLALALAASLLDAARGLALNLEEVDATLTLRRGKVPGWLDGKMVINGPSVHDFRGFGVDVETGHFFDGLAGLVAFDFSDGEVALRTRLVRSETLRRLEEHGQYDSMTFGTPLAWRSLASSPLGILLDNTPICLYASNGTLFATSDSSYRHGVDPETLETLSAHTTDQVGPLGAAHPAVDPETGEVYNYAGPTRVRLDMWALEPVGEYELVREYHEGPRHELRRETLATIWAPAPWVAHSVGLTPNFVIYRVMSERPRLGLDASYLSNFLQFDRSAKAKVAVVHRRSHALTELTCQQSFSSFHIINSFERNGGGAVVIDSVASSTGLLDERTKDVFSRGYKPANRRPEGPVNDAADVEYLYKRCVISLRGPRACHCRDLFRYPFELPAINPLWRGKPHRFVWGAGGEGRTLWTNQIVKVDLARVSQGDHITVWRAPPGFVSGEPRMVPRPTAAEDAAEDDGVVLVVLTAEAHAETRLAVLDAATLREQAVLALPIDLPVQTHSVYLDRRRDGRIYPN